VHLKLLSPKAFFSPKRTKYRLAAGLCPDPLGSLQRSPSPLAGLKGPTSKGRGRDSIGGERKGREGERKGRGGRRKGREGKGGTWYPHMTCLHDLDDAPGKSCRVTSCCVVLSVLTGIEFVVHFDSASFRQHHPINDAFFVCTSARA